MSWAIQKIKNGEEFIDLCDVQVKDQDLVLLSEWIKQGGKVKDFRVYFCIYLEVPFGLSSFERFCENVFNVNNSSLQVLCLSKCQLTIGHARLLSNAIRQNKTLKELIISFNNIGREGARDIFCNLSENTTLKSLIVHSNEIEDLPELNDIFANLPPNLEELDISHNKIRFFPLSFFVNMKSKLREFTCHNNPWEKPPKEIMEQGLDAIRSYLLK